MEPPYRDAREALAHRAAELTRQLADLTARRDELAALDSQIAALRRDLEATDATRRALDGGGSLPALDDVQVASPCPARWEDMKGDDRTRYCGQCRKNVYNLSAMDRAEAQAFVAAHTGEICVRFFRRADGTLLTRDCPVGARRRIGKRVALVVLASGAAAAAGTAVALHGGHEAHAVMGDTGLRTAPVQPVQPQRPAIADEPPVQEELGQRVAPVPAIRDPVRPHVGRMRIRPQPQVMPPEHTGPSPRR